MVREDMLPEFLSNRVHRYPDNDAFWELQPCWVVSVNSPIRSVAVLLPTPGTFAVRQAADLGRDYRQCRLTGLNKRTF